MTSSIAQRITSRIEFLKKNPSNVALEAGLGRSAVRDILVGKVENPRIDTLRKLAGPLQCSLDYLTGESEDVGTPEQSRALAQHGWHFDPIEVAFTRPVQAGVFKSGHVSELSPHHWESDSQGERVLRPDERYLVYRDLRLPDWETELFRIKDRSMEELGIRAGDQLTVAHPWDDSKIPLRAGIIVVVQRTLRSKAKGSFVDDLDETSARQVEITPEGIALRTRSKDSFPPLIIHADALAEYEELDEHAEKILPNTYFTKDDGMVRILGIAVRLTRDLPID